MESKLIKLLTFILISLSGYCQEICNNNIDDDGDRLIDLYDVEDCPCTHADTFKISLIPNPSFEDLNCIPTNFSQMNCAVGWSQATLATSDLYSELGFTTSFLNLPIPDGTNCVGTIFEPDWMEYIGTCLYGPMLAGKSYLLEFDVSSAVYALDPEIDFSSSSIDLVLFGNTSCDSFPIQTTDCPENFGWKTLGKIRYTMQKQWSKVSMFFTPQEDIYSVMLGGTCDYVSPFTTNSGGQMVYVFWDNLQLNLGNQEVIYFIPNTFTPNGDEFNQRFNPVFVCGYDPYEYHFEIYNRWGEVIFESFDPESGWDGTYNDFPAGEGVFLWKLQYKATNSAERKMLTGHLNLLR